MRFGFVKTACATPAIRVADCAATTRSTRAGHQRSRPKGCGSTVPAGTGADRVYL